MPAGTHQPQFSPKCLASKAYHPSLVCPVLAGRSVKQLQLHYSDFFPDYFSLAEKPPAEFCLSPDGNTESISVDLRQKKGKSLVLGWRWEGGHPPPSQCRGTRLPSHPPGVLQVSMNTVPWPLPMLIVHKHDSHCP